MMKLPKSLPSKLSFPSLNSNFYPLSILVIIHTYLFRYIFLGRTRSAVASQLTSIWPWRAYPHQYTEPLVATDQADSYFPWSVHITRSIRHGHLALWNADSFGGIPFLSNGQSSAAYPIRLFTSLFMGPSLQHDILIFAHILIGGIGFYFLLKRFGSSNFASCAGALFWMYSPINFVWLQFEFFLVITAWLPWAVYCVVRILDREHAFRYSALLSLSIALMLTGSNVQFAIIASIPVFGYLFLGLLFEDITFSVLVRWRHKTVKKKVYQNIYRAFLFTLLNVILSVCLAAISVIPTFVLSQNVGRAPLTYQEFISSSNTVNISSYLRYSAVHLPVPYGERQVYQMGFVGAAVILFALFGFFSRQRGSLFARIVVAVTFLATIGTSVAWIFYTFIPGISYTRSLGRASFLWSFGLCILAGIGIDTLLSIARKISAKTAKFSHIIVPLTTVAIVTCVLINIVQTTRYGFYINPMPVPRTARYSFAERPLIRAIEKELGPDDRLLPLSRGDQEWSPPMMYASHHLVFNIPSASGYESVMPEKTVDTWRIVAGESVDTALDTMLQGSYIQSYTAAKLRWDLLDDVGVTLIAASPDIDEDKGWQQHPEKYGVVLREIYSGSDGKLFRIYDNASKFEPTANCVKSDSQSARIFFSTQTFVLHKDCKINATISSSTPGWIKRSFTSNPNSIRYSVDSPRHQWLFIPVSYDKGWSAHIDGKKAEVYDANYSFMAVKITPGKHSIKLTYAPEGFRLGKTLSILGIIMCGALVLPETFYRRLLRYSARSKISSSNER